MKVVGIAGGTASGKTTLTRALVEHLGPRARLLAHDQYYRSLPDRYRGGREIEYNYDEPAALDNQLLADHIARLTRGETVAVPDYDFTVSARTPESSWQAVCMGDAEILIVEGILVLAVPELRACFDQMLYVHTPDDVRLVRRLKRDIVERGHTVEGVLSQYMATVRPMHQQHVDPSRVHASHVLDGEAPTAASLATTLTLLGL